MRFLLGASFGSDPKGTPIAKFVMHHADKTVSERPLVLGHDAVDWWVAPPPPGEGKPVVAWSGSNPASRAQNATIHLYVVTWNNPRPEQEIESLDFISAKRITAPFLVAVTVV